MRCPSSPGHGASSRPGRSFWNLTQKTFRPLLLPAGGFGDAVCPQLSAMAGLYHLPFRVDRELQQRVRLAKRAFDEGRRRSAREDETEIARPFGQRHEPLVDFRGDLHGLDVV